MTRYLVIRRLPYPLRQDQLDLILEKVLTYDPYEHKINSTKVERITSKPFIGMVKVFLDGSPL